MREYWIVYPYEKTLTIFFLDDNGKYTPSKPLTAGDITKSKVLQDLNLNLEEIFEDIVKEPQEEYNVRQKRLDP